MIIDSGEPAYVGRQQDGSLALVPIWMTEESAAAMTLVGAPRLALSCLRDLRREIDTFLNLLDGDSRVEERAMQQRQPISAQSDLFAAQTAPRELPSDIRQRLLPLIEALLSEAAKKAREADHEDHA
ncbi:hypothetical protein NKI71_31840 [Mesorhizobium sp. M0510]|uniref:hypothetical protein n=1 Tax=Mesorhizobium sp. M0510 TaxID=2956954 RepID=UPI00333BA9D5